MKKYFIVYHKEDNDGVFSASIFYDYIINVLNLDPETIRLMGADYNELAQFVKDNSPESLHKEFENIIVTDISFNAKYMKKLWNEFKHNFTWVDHHAPIIQASHELNFDDVPGVRDTTRSAILNAWKHLYDPFDEAYNEKKVPELLRILSAYDSWTYEKEGYEFDYVRNINKGITISYKLNFEDVYELVHEIALMYIEPDKTNPFPQPFVETQLIMDMHKFGKQLNDYDDQVMADIIKSSGDISWKVNQNGTLYDACAIFHEGATNSTIFKTLKGTGIRNGLVFKHQKNGNWVLSMYNVNDEESFHCGEFLKAKYNGGGHKGAAGCTITQDQFIKILKLKEI